MPDIPTPAQVALVRRRYAEGATMSAVRAEAGGLSAPMVHRCLAGDFGDGSGEPLEPIPLRRARVRGRGGNRRTIVRRLWRAAELQVDYIEERLVAAGLEPAERESDTRALAVLTRTLRELSALDREHQSRQAKPRDNDENDDAVPIDIDELRRELARRVDALVAARSADGPAGGPD